MWSGMFPGTPSYDRSRIVDIWRQMVNTDEELPCNSLERGLMEIQYHHCQVLPNLIIQRLVYASVHYHSCRAFEQLRRIVPFHVIYGPDPCDPAAAALSQTPFHITHHTSGRKDLFHQGKYSAMIITTQRVERVGVYTGAPDPNEHGESSWKKRTRTKRTPRHPCKTLMNGNSSTPSSGSASVTAKDAFQTLTIGDDQTDPEEDGRTRGTRGRGGGRSGRDKLARLDTLNASSSTALSLSNLIPDATLGVTLSSNQRKKAAKRAAKAEETNDDGLEEENGDNLEDEEKDEVKD